MGSRITPGIFQVLAAVAKGVVGGSRARSGGQCRRVEESIFGKEVLRRVEIARPGRNHAPFIDQVEQLSRREGQPRAGALLVGNVADVGHFAGRGGVEDVPEVGGAHRRGQVREQVAGRRVLPIQKVLLRRRGVVGQQLPGLEVRRPGPGIGARLGARSVVTGTGGLLAVAGQTLHRPLVLEQRLIEPDVRQLVGHSVGADGFRGCWRWSSLGCTGRRTPELLIARLEDGDRAAGIFRPVSFSRLTTSPPTSVRIELLHDASSGQLSMSNACPAAVRGVCVRLAASSASTQVQNLLGLAWVPLE